MSGSQFYADAQGVSDEAIGRQLNKSARQVCKMREIAKKADASLLEKIQNGSVSINKAHEIIKTLEAKKKPVLLKKRLMKNLLILAKASILILLNLGFCLFCQNLKMDGRKVRF